MIINGRVKHSGVAFEYGDTKLIVPPLSVKQVRGLSDTLKEHDRMISDTDSGTLTERMMATLDHKIRVVTAALSRNYPDITEDEVSEFVTMDNSNDVFYATIGVVGKDTVKVKELVPDFIKPVVTGQTS
jgi:hypothetical protein